MWSVDIWTHDDEVDASALCFSEMWSLSSQALSQSGKKSQTSSEVFFLSRSVNQ